MTGPARFARYTVVLGSEDVSPSKMGHRDPSSGAAMRRVALLVDGMARAAIVPFGPRLIHRLIFHKNWFGAASELDPSTWSQVAFPFAILIAVYTVGRSFGCIISRHLPLNQLKLPQHVARLGGAAFALHLYTFGAGLNSVRWLVVIRFLSAIVSGFMSIIADFPLPEDKSVEAFVEDDEMMEEGTLCPDTSARADRLQRKRSAYLDVTPTTAKIFMTGFAITIITGGLLYRHASTSSIVQALTGAYKLTVSPLFFLAVSLAVEWVLRCVFACSTDRSMRVEADERKVGPVRCIVNSIVRRQVRTSNSVSDRSPDAPHPADRHDDHQIEFQDPLRLSRHYGTPSRSRLNSTKSDGSMSEFFDCNSSFTDEIIDLDADPLMTDMTSSGDCWNVSETVLALYQHGRCVYPDGSPAFVTQGDSIANPPQNYIDFCKGDREKALKKWKKTQEWRKDKDVWEIHRHPHTLFSRIKEAYPHIIHGHSKTGQVVVYEHPGRMNLKQLFRSGCKVSDMLEHLTFFLEYVGNCVGSRSQLRELNGADSGTYSFSSWGTMVVMDIQGCSLTSLTGDVMSYLSQSSALQTDHYPNVLKRVFVVNCPFFVAGAWSMIKGIVPESVHVEILSSSNALEAMRKYIDDDQIPPEYGGSSPYALGEHPYEVGLNDLVKKAGESQCDDTKAPTLASEPILDSSFSFDHGERRRVNDEPKTGTKDERKFSEMSKSNESSLISPNIRPLRRRLSSRDERSEESILDSSFSFDHSERRRIYDEPKMGKNYEREVSKMVRPKNSSLISPSVLPLRRRLSSRDEIIDESSPFTDDFDIRDTSSGSDGKILFMVSILYISWCAVQGVMETTIPLWLLSPAMLGGLGYTPSRSGMALFSTSMVLLWLTRTKVARVVSHIPNKDPMRAFRIAVGSEAALLALLTLVPSLVT